MKRLASLALALLLAVAAGCASEEAEQARFGPPPHCRSQPIARTLLIAQSVPGAELVPCYDGLPVGLELKAVSVDSAGTRYTFDIDRYDGPVWMTFGAACTVEDPAREERVEQSGGFDVTWFSGRSEAGNAVHGARFTGGCLVFEFGEQSLADTAEAHALIEAVRLISRDELAAFADWEL